MKLLLALFVNTLALIVTAYVVPGIKVDSLTTAIVAAIVLGVINTIIKPILLFLTLPITIVTLGLFVFVINAVVLWLASSIVPGFDVNGFVPAILGAIVLSLVSTFLSALTKSKE